jgi:hypothetical protein
MSTAVPNHPSMNISGGGSFLVTAVSGTILTTGANEYAKVKLRGHYTDVNVSTSTGTISVGGNIIARASSSNGAIVSFHNEQYRDISGSATGIESFDVIVPPSSSLTFAFPASGAGEISGSFVKLANT